MPREAAPVLSRGAGCDTAQENRTAYNSQRRSVIAASRQWLKTGAELRRQQQHYRRAEFFALPILVSATPYRPIRPSIRPLNERPDPLLPGYSILDLNPGIDYPVWILGKFVYLIQGQPEMICYQLCGVRGQP
jgi:hypothetical protein